MNQQISSLPESTPEDTKEIRNRILIFGIIASVVLAAVWGVATYFAKVNYDKVSAGAEKARQETETLKQRRSVD